MIRLTYFFILFFFAIISFVACSKSVHEVKQERNMQEIEANLKPYTALKEHLLTEYKKMPQKDKMKLSSSLSKMRKKVDEDGRVTWYRDRSTPNPLEKTGILLYIGQFHDTLLKPNIRLCVQYSGSNWLFVRSFSVYVDGFRYYFPSVEWKHGNADGKVWEVYDECLQLSELYGNQYNIMKSIIASKKAVLRFEGEYGHRDYTITAKDKAAMQHVLDAYMVLLSESKGIASLQKYYFVSLKKIV